MGNTRLTTRRNRSAGDRTGRQAKGMYCGSMLRALRFDRSWAVVDEVGLVLIRGRGIDARWPTPSGHPRPRANPWPRWRPCPAKGWGPTLFGRGGPGGVLVGLGHLLSPDWPVFP